MIKLHLCHDNIASSPGPSQIFLHGCKIKSGRGLGTRLMIIYINYDSSQLSKHSPYVQPVNTRLFSPYHFSLVWVVKATEQHKNEVSEQHARPPYVLHAYMHNFGHTTSERLTTPLHQAPYTCWKSANLRLLRFLKMVTCIRHHIGISYHNPEFSCTSMLDFITQYNPCCTVTNFVD